MPSARVFSFSFSFYKSSITALVALAAVAIAAPAAADDTTTQVSSSAPAATPPAPAPAPAPSAEPVPFSPYAGNNAHAKESELAAMKLAALIGLASGAAVLGTGAYFGYRSVDAQDTAAEHCRTGSVCDARGKELHANADEWRNFATTTMAVGGGLLLAGGILFGIAHLRTGAKKLEPPQVGKLKIEPGLGQLNVKTTF